MSYKIERLSKYIFDDENYNCSINTKVRYTKDAEGKESYEYNMTCEDNDGNKVYEHKGIENDEECSVIDQNLLN